MAVAESRGEDICQPICTLDALLADAATLYPDKIAFVCRYQPPDLLHQTSGSSAGRDCLRWTYSQLRSIAHRFAIELYSSGICRGMRIAAFLKSSAHYAVTLHASAILGCVFVPINPSLTSRSEQLDHILALASPNVLIAWDAGVAYGLSHSLRKRGAENLVLKIICNESSNVPTGWLSMDDMLDPLSQTAKTLPTNWTDSGDNDLALVIFTSGTTSLPKGVRHINKTLVAGIRSSVQGLEINSSRSLCSILPPFHAFGLIMMLDFWSSGGCVCVPSETFEPATVMKIIREEGLTHLAGVSTMMHAVTATQLAIRNEVHSLVHIIVSGSVITPDVMRRTSRMLGVENISASFGMSEVVPALGTSFRDLPITLDDDLASSGKCFPGVHIRICSPSSRRSVERGTAGELHVGGFMVSDGYVGQDQGRFYDEDGLSWIATGDEAVMKSDGEVIILGRLKDMIIRAGENIAPSSIEAVIDKVPGHLSQVVGVPDEVAGEVPLAIVKTTSGAPFDVEEIRAVIKKTLGPTFLPTEILLIQDLGLEDFPRTESGKVRKNELSTRAANFLRDRTRPDTGSGGDVETSLKGMWCNLLHIAPRHLMNSTPITEMADSIVLMQAAHQIEQKLRVYISPQEILQHSTVDAQAKLIQARNQEQSKTQQSAVETRNGPPELIDIAPALGDPEKKVRIQAAVEKIAADMGLSWNQDVEDILPIWDFGQVTLRPLRPESWNARRAFLARHTNAAALRHALERALAHHPMFRTCVVKPQGAPRVHVVVRPTLRWYQLTVKEVDVVATVDDIRRLFFDYSKLDVAKPPGPLFRALIVPVAENDSAALLYQVHHSCYDSLSLPNLTKDIEVLLAQGKGAELPTRVPYKWFADTSFLHSGSQNAQTDVDYHVRRLKRLDKLGDSLLPVKRAPQWFIGRSNLAGPQMNDSQASLDVRGRQGVDGISKRARMIGLQATKERCSASASSIVKSAVAILNCHLNQTNTAIFANYEAGRSWPFHEAWISDRLPNAMGINGPTFELVLNVVDINESDSSLELIERLHKEQALLTKHAHAPLWAIQEQLGFDGIDLIDLMRRQTFNWLPTIRENVYDPPYMSILKRIQGEGHPDTGLAWVCGMLDNETLYVKVRYDDAQLQGAEVEEAINKSFQIVAWMTDPENWSRPLREISIV